MGIPILSDIFSNDAYQPRVIGFAHFEPIPDEPDAPAEGVPAHVYDAPPWIDDVREPVAWADPTPDPIGSPSPTPPTDDHDQELERP